MSLVPLDLDLLELAVYWGSGPMVSLDSVLVKLADHLDLGPTVLILPELAEHLGEGSTVSLGSVLTEAQDLDSADAKLDLVLTEHLEPVSYPLLLVAVSCPLSLLFRVAA